MVLIWGAPVDSWIWEHRAAIDFAVRAFMLAAGAFALWSTQRDVRAAWRHARQRRERIAKLGKERNHDT